MPNKHLFLPKILNGANIDEPVANAVWEDKSKKVILSISDGIEIDESAHTRGVSSIPDIYARPLTFLSALRTDTHPLRKRVLQEWKGLLSLLALHKVKPDLNNLSITPVTLNDEKFSKALKNLAPRKVKLQNNGIEYSWTDILLIKFDNIPIGAFSPATLVYTSADYNKELLDRPFSLKDENGFLRPPTSKQDLEYVGEWVEWFTKRFNQSANTSEDTKSSDHKFAGDLNKLLDSWLLEIKQELGIGKSESLDAVKVKIADEPIEIPPSSFLPKYDIYNLILTPLVKDENYSAGLNKSDYALKLMRKSAGYSEVVVITPQLLAQDKDLWDGTKPSGLNKDTTSLVQSFFKESWGTKISNINLQQNNAIWIRPELYFLTNSLLKAKSGDILPEGEKYLNANNTSYILPFRQELLQYYSPDQIRDVLKPRFESKEEKIIFSFDLPLADNTSIEVKKVYKTKSVDTSLGEGQIIEADVPVLEIFPNYLGDFWCQYFMLCSDIDNFKVMPISYNSNIKVTRNSQSFETNTSRNKAEILRISGYDSFPEAVTLASNTGKDELYGLVLINKDKDVESKPFNEKIRVGIDFGTSNTNVFKYTGGNASKWSFSFSRYLRRILNSPSDKRNSFAQLFFVPAADKDLPIPTAIRIFKAGVTTNLLLDYFIYFPDDYKYPTNVYTDIKWDEDSSKMNSFLKSLIYLLLVDIIKDRKADIEFRCSFPKSFSDAKLSAYKSVWIETLESMFYIGDEKDNIPDTKIVFVEKGKFDDEGGIYTIGTKNNGKFSINIKPKFETEGIAAGEYFSSELIITDGVSHANKEDGAVCIDVGGGTSDYSIWSGSKIRLDASVLLAGRQISKLLKNNSRVRDILFESDAATALNEVKDDDALFSSRLNYALRKEEKLISSKLISNANNKDIAWLRRILAIEFGALSFYAAHLCLALDEFLGRQFSKNVIQSGLKLHWGGNAAKFINWIDYGRYEKDGIASKFLNGMFVNTIMDKSIGERTFRPAVLGQVQSPGHKDEASGGIVVMNFSNSANQSSVDVIDDLLIDDGPVSKEILDGVIIGDKVQINGTSYDHYHVINKDTLFLENSSSFGATELIQLERFVYLINQVGKNTGLFPEGSQINLTTEEKIAIKNRVKNDFAALARLKPDQRNVEPVFIMEVKYLLDILSNKMK